MRPSLRVSVRAFLTMIVQFYSAIGWAACVRSADNCDECASELTEVFVNDAAYVARARHRSNSQN